MEKTLALKAKSGLKDLSKEHDKYLYYEESRE